MYHANRTWLKSVRRHLRKTLLDGLTEASKWSKPLSFISHPVPECACLRYDSFDTSSNATSPSTSQVWAALGVAHRCPAWMDSDLISQSKEKENEEEMDEDDSKSSEQFFRRPEGKHEGGAEVNNKEENQFEDQDELEGGER